MTTKVQYLFAVFIFLLMSPGASSQNTYPLAIAPADKTAEFIQSLNLRHSFADRDDCSGYLQQLIPQLQAKGYVTASIDSVRLDSTSAYIQLFVGGQYQWDEVYSSAEAQQWMQLAGWNRDIFTGNVLNYQRLEALQNQLLQYFENNGYPFARIFMDSLRLFNHRVSGRLNVEPGPLYKIDSIKITGNAKISNSYLQHFLEIKNGSVYSKEKLQGISERLRQLNYVEETFSPKFYWGTSGGVVELFLQQKKSSQVNFIIGIVPDNERLSGKKVNITGEGLLHLNNALGAGETIGLVWQKLQATSQRLNVAYAHPYLFNTPFGIDFSFDMLKKDSAYLNFDIKLGAQYVFNPRQDIKLFVQQFRTILGGVNINQVLQTRRLPAEADLSLTSLGLEYRWRTTNYIFNPVSGFDFALISAAGNKTIKPNNQILELKDDNDPAFSFASLYDTVKVRSYQFRSQFIGAKYFPLGKNRRSTLKTALYGGYLGGGQIFVNELFRVGGYRLLRGFDEQSELLSQYALGTLEYRYLVGQNSFFSAFTDGGWGRNTARGFNNNHTYISAGLGMAFETKLGLFQLAWAVGSRNDTGFNLRRSKIHFAFVNYF